MTYLSFEVLCTLFGGLVGSAWLNTKESYPLITRFVLLFVSGIGSLGACEYLGLMDKPFTAMLVGMFCGVLAPITMKIVYAASPELIEKALRKASDRVIK